MRFVRTLVLLVLLALPAAFAQGIYLGVSLGTPLTNQIDDFTEAAELGAQLGVDFIPYFGARIGIEGNPFSGGLKLGGVDLLARTYIPLTYHNIYAGVGVDGFYLVEPSTLSELQAVNVSAHAIVGAELRLSGERGFALFAEVLPSYLIGDDIADISNLQSYYLRARGGLNYHF